VGLILDGGECAVGLESTIIDMSGSTPTILRPGMITAETIEKVLGTTVRTKRQDTPAIRAPGMHHLHYAPITKTVLLTTPALHQFMQHIKTEDLPMAVVTQSDITMPINTHIRHIKMPADAKAYAHDLYHTLRSLDHQRLKQILIENVPEGADWEAIRDRLCKATAKR
jgi:L-threonylcarbamoyladenylate synthase